MCYEPHTAVLRQTERERSQDRREEGRDKEETWEMQRGGSEKAEMRGRAGGGTGGERGRV